MPPKCSFCWCKLLGNPRPQVFTVSLCAWIGQKPLPLAHPRSPHTHKHNSAWDAHCSHCRESQDCVFKQIASQSPLSLIISLFSLYWSVLLCSTCHTIKPAGQPILELRWSINTLILLGLHMLSPAKLTFFVFLNLRQQIHRLYEYIESILIKGISLWGSVFISATLLQLKVFSFYFAHFHRRPRDKQWQTCVLSFLELVESHLQVIVIAELRYKCLTERIMMELFCFSEFLGNLAFHALTTDAMKKASQCGGQGPDRSTLELQWEKPQSAWGSASLFVKGI